MIVADSDVLIDSLRGDRAADRITFELGHGQLTTTAISAFEWVVGATTSHCHITRSIFRALRTWRSEVSNGAVVGHIERQELRANLAHEVPRIRGAMAAIQGYSLERCQPSCDTAAPAETPPRGTPHSARLHRCSSAAEPR